MFTSSNTMHVNEIQVPGYVIGSLTIRTCQSKVYTFAVGLFSAGQWASLKATL